MRRVSRRNWKGIVDKTVELTEGATPPASIELLISSAMLTMDAITAPYAQPGIAVDAQDSALLSRRTFGLMIAPYGDRARAWITVWTLAGAGGALSLNELGIESTNTSGIPAAPASDALLVASQDPGQHVYGWVAGGVSVPHHHLTSDWDTTAPVAACDREFELADSSQPYQELFRVGTTGGWGGFGLQIARVRTDIEV